jgi:hypothetical protein
VVRYLPISEVLYPTKKLNNSKYVWILLIFCDLHELVYCTLWGGSFMDLSYEERYLMLSVK